MCVVMLFQTQPEQKGTSMNVTLPCKSLKAALQSVLPHASTDKLRPIERSVHMYVHAGNVLCEATDRYTLGMCRVPLGEFVTTDDESFTVNLPLDDVKALIKFLGTVMDILPVTISVNESDKVTVEAAYGSMSFISQLGEFPKVRGIVPAIPEPGKAMDVVTYDPQLLAKFSVSARAFRVGKSDPVVTVINPKVGGGAAQVTIGEDFLGLIMMVRHHGSPTAARESWGSIL